MTNKEDSGFVALGCTLGIIAICAYVGATYPQEDTHGIVPSSPPYVVTHASETEYPEALPLDPGLEVPTLPIPYAVAGDSITLPGDYLGVPRGELIVDPWVDVRTPENTYVPGTDVDGVHPTGATQSGTAEKITSAIFDRFGIKPPKLTRPDQVDE